MKIKVIEKSYEEVMELPGFTHKDPVHSPRALRWLIRQISRKELKKVHFHCEKEGMERLAPDESALILMNHSCFLDLKIASEILYPREFHIVCTTDGFVGKEKLLRKIGCIPAFKFITDPSLVRDMIYVIRQLNSSVLMFPEATYSFDGTQATLPSSLGKCLKMLKVPVVMVRTYGAFQRDPLYNGLQVRQTDVSAKMKYLFSPQEIENYSAEELNALLAKEFTYDHFRWQSEKGIHIREPFRADGLERVLYRCPNCASEGNLYGEGTHLTCSVCRKSYELTETGMMKAVKGKTEFPYISDWYRWERECVRTEIEVGRYQMRLPVEIYVMVNMDALYHVGEGVLLHTSDGFQLTGCGGRLHYTQPARASYSLYADYYWYEIGDMISIGNRRVQYYCIPKRSGANVAKARMAAEELYKKA